MEEKIINISFGTARIFDHIIEIIIDEGVTFQSGDLDELFKLFNTHFPDRKFAYLSNRIKDYSIELTPNLYNSFHENLTATAVVCYTEASFKNAKFEKAFYKNIPFEVFRDYEDAVEWLGVHLQNKKAGL